jgi:hypothetical protein
MADDKEAIADAPKNGATSPIIIKLRNKVPNGEGDDVDELKFREPTGADIERVGNPINIDMMSGDTPKVTFDTKIMTQMMSTLAAVPPSTIRKMHTRDWNTAAWSLTSFFMPDW